MKSFALVRALAVLVALLSAPIAQAGAGAPPPSGFEPAAIWDGLRQRSAPERVFAAACCKTCHKGKACGDSCISRNCTCHKPPGCACDG